jgi:hypothetical protein
MQRRGFALDDLFGSIGIVLVRAEIERVSEVLRQLVGAPVETNVYGRPATPTSRPIFQFTGHSWTTFLWDIGQEDLVKRLSRTLATACIYFQHEDTSGWSGYEFIDQGDVLEQYQFGLDYSVEFSDWDGESGAEATALMDDGISWEIDITDETGEQYRFRSTLRTATEAEVRQAQSFMERFFTAQQAWLPGWDCIPDVTRDHKTVALSRADFVRVDALRL